MRERRAWLWRPSVTKNYDDEENSDAQPGCFPKSRHGIKERKWNMTSAIKKHFRESTIGGARPSIKRKCITRAPSGGKEPKRISWIFQPYLHKKSWCCCSLFCCVLLCERLFYFFWGERQFRAFPSQKLGRDSDVLWRKDDAMPRKPRRKIWWIWKRMVPGRQTCWRKDSKNLHYRIHNIIGKYPNAH